MNSSATLNLKYVLYLPLQWIFNESGHLVITEQCQDQIAII